MRTTSHAPTFAQARRALLDRRALMLKLRGAMATHEQELSEQRPAEVEERATDRSQAAVLTRLSERELAELRAIDEALGRIDAGTYGRCAGCGDRIAPARLRAVPETTHCRTCAGS